jgi:hypothetical protein
MKAVRRQADLPQIVRALRPPRRLASTLHRRQQRSGSTLLIGELPLESNTRRVKWSRGTVAMLDRHVLGMNQDRHTFSEVVTRTPP